MKRKAKQNGSGGRLRLTLLLATAAAFLLVPAAAASAGAPITIVPKGGGAGVVENFGHDAFTTGTQTFCHWNGTVIDADIDASAGGVNGDGKCQGEAWEEIGFKLAGYFRHPDSGSEIPEAFELEGTAPFGGCGAFEEECSFFASTPVTMKVPFKKTPKPKFGLSTTTSGTAGSVECKINGGAKGPCPTEVEEESSVELFAAPGVGSELNEWTTGPCAASSSSPCSFTMPSSAVSANADFKVASETLSVTVGGGGSGSVACEVNASPASCNGTYSYGDSVKVVATPASENIVESLTGTGSAAGNCNAETGICEFTLTAPSSVTAIFESAGTKAQVEGNVHGEVPITTSLESACSDVDLGEFIPATLADYTNSCALTATSTGAATSLTASDGSAVHTGHLVQGSYFLPSPLETKANAGSFASLESPVTLLTYSEPVSADAVSVSFKQHIGLHDGLHTGTYAKTITLTLEQTTP